MSDLGPCDTCGTPYEQCPVSDDDAQWTTDANGNHDGLCCEDCFHRDPDWGRPLEGAP